MATSVESGSVPLIDLLSEVRACQLCAHELIDGVRPVIQAAPQARILIAGQAPGARVHASGVPFDDASGERLRSWMGLGNEDFYNPEQVAILPMAFCFPGHGRSGDKPPPPRCAEAWRERLLSALPALRLTLLIGQYAQAWHLPGPRVSVTQAVQNWRSGPAERLPLPHPSPRNNRWLSRNPWFEQELLPVLRERVRAALQ